MPCSRRHPRKWRTRFDIECKWSNQPQKDAASQHHTFRRPFWKKREEEKVVPAILQDASSLQRMTSIHVHNFVVAVRTDLRRSSTGYQILALLSSFLHSFLLSHSRCSVHWAWDMLFCSTGWMVVGWWRIVSRRVYLLPCVFFRAVLVDAAQSASWRSANDKRVSIGLIAFHGHCMVARRYTVVACLIMLRMLLLPILEAKFLRVLSFTLFIRIVLAVSPYRRIELLQRTQRS